MTTGLKNRRFSRHAGGILWVVPALALATGVEDVAAQTPGQQRTAQASSGLESRTQAPPGLRPPSPLFMLGGVPVYVWAPVPPPYIGSAYDTFHGQPMRGGESVLRSNEGGAGP